MKNKVRKGLHDIITHGAMTDDAKNPQRKYLGAASLELKKTLCQKVREAARKRIAEMDRKIADLDAEMVQLLGTGGASKPGRPGTGSGRNSTEEPASLQGRGFTLKY
jgi:hypothetical protein